MGTNLATASTICPFCKGAVPADTIRFGGNCPHCMLEIPGEEAPTDPGKVARLRAEAEAQKQRKASRRRNAAVGALALLLLSVGGAAGFWQYQKQQEALVIEFEEFYQVPLDQLQTAPHPEAALPAPGTKPTASKPRTAQGSVGSVARPQADATAPEAPAAMKGASGTGPAGDALPEGLQKAASAPATGGFGSSNIGVERVGLGDKVLTDDTEIYEMAKRVINSFSPQLQTCYNQRLKLVDGLAGAWKLSFVIGKDGLTKNVGVTGVNVQDGELESCMSRAVQAWKFQRIAKDQPVTKTYRFGAASW